MAMKWKQLVADTLVIHCSATPADADIGAREIKRWHRLEGWLDIGYHYVIRRDGTVEVGRPDDRPGAGVHGENLHTLHVCLVGGVNRVKDRDGKDDVDGPRWDMLPANNFTDEQWHSLYTLTLELTKKHPSIVKAVGHRDFPGVKKACPCFDVREDFLRKHGPLVSLM
jgi:N-acetylmuramoyl-L-alanine amidase